MSVFDGLQNTLTQWLARYINVFLWLPVANIFGAIIGKVQENMLKLDLSQLQSSGSTFFSSTDTAYIVFLIIGIIGYFCVPTAAGYIVHAAGGGGLLQRVNTLVIQSSSTAASTTYQAGSMAVEKLGKMLRRDDPKDQDWQINRLSGKK